MRALSRGLVLLRVLNAIQSTHWFRVQLTIPPNWTGREVHFVWDAGNEGLIFSEDGLPLQGLTGGGSGAIRKEYVLSRHASGGSTYRFYLEMSCVCSKVQRATL